MITVDGKLFIGDYDNNRILAYSSLPTVSNASADFVLGQPDFTSTTATVTQNSHRRPQQVVSAAGKLIVAEYSSHRIMIYNSIPTSGSAVPDVVVGQPDFTSSNSACSADGLFRVETVAVTPGGKLIATDSSNNRLLIWNAIPTSNGQPADVVLGQADFTHCTEDDDDQDGIADATPSARSLDYPAGIWTDGTRLVVSDSDNNRVLIWNQVPTTSFQPADIVLGQASFTKFTENDDNQDSVADVSPSARTLSYPYDGIDSNGVQLAVADNNNNRVLIWNTFPTTNFQPADVVLGQATFSGQMINDDNQDGVDDGIGSARVLELPSGILFHHNKLMIADTENNRFLIFQSR